MNNITGMFYPSFALLSLLLFHFVEVSVVEAFSLGQVRFDSRICEVYESATCRRSSSLSETTNSEIENFDDWSDERKAGLFQFLLRDLEIEGVPLLGCDGVAANKTLQGATWTVAGQLSENDFERKVCLVLEDIPVKDLKIFIDTFSSIKKQDRLMDSLHDLRRFSLSPVGNGIGPAMILETRNRTETEIAQYESITKETPEPNESKWRSAIEAFVKRSFPELDNDATAYRFLGSSDACDILSGYWNCICELEAADSPEANTIVLSCPPMSDEGSLARFAAISEVINTLNSAYPDYEYDLVYFHPSYDNDEVQSQNEPADGHIPPTSVLQNTLLRNKDDESVENLTDEQIRLQNYLRKSPLPGLIITRASNGNGSGRIDYETVIRLANEGEEKLKAAVMEEINLISD